MAAASARPARIGEAVNVASRIQALNNAFNTRGLICAATRSRLTPVEGFEALPAVRVEGCSAEVEVFALA